MKKGGSKSKGNKFERAVARLLDVWWEEPKNTFWRTVNSGGWKQPGDLAPRISPSGEVIKFPFVVECKFYHKIDLWDTLKQTKTARLAVWWKQLSREKLQYEKSDRICRLLVFKQDFSPICVGFSIGEIDKFINCMTNSILLADIACIRLGVSGIAEHITVITWDNFIKFYPKTIFKV